MTAARVLAAVICCCACLCRLRFLQLLLGGEHGVPCGEHGWFLVKNLQYVLGDIFLVNHKAEHILIEPCTGHYECAVETRLCAPTVLNLPHLGLLFIVKVYGHRCCDAQEWQRLQ